MTVDHKIRYDRIFQQVIHKGGELEINYTNKVQNAQVLSLSVGNSYSEDQLMHVFLDNFHQGINIMHKQIATRQSQEERKILLNKNIYIFHLYILII